MAFSMWSLSKLIPSTIKPFRALQLVRWNSLQSTSNVGVDMNDDTGICTLTMQNAPVNTVTMDMWTDLHTSLTTLHNMEKCKAVILTSNQRVFSSGLDLTEFIGGYTDKDRFRKYWTIFLDTIVQLYTMRPFTVASINASSPAGGCVMAMATDYRIMTRGKYVIGLNEPQLKLDIPNWIIAMYCNIVGDTVAMRHLPRGKLLSVDEALSVGLIDEVCEQEELAERTLAYVTELITIDEESRYKTKMYIREQVLNRINGYREADTDYRVGYFARDDIHNLCQGYMANLKKPKN